MWVYTLILVWFALTDIIINPNINKRRKELYVFLSMIPLLILSAIRSINIGNDTITYHNLYYWSQEYPINEFILNYKTRWEIGFLYLNKFLSEISSNPQLLIVVSSIYVYFIISWFLIKYSNNSFYSLFLFITMRYYFFFFSNIRQSIAIATLLIAFDLLVSEKKIRFVFTVFIAYFFHTTAIVFLFALVIKKIPIKKSILIIVAIVSTILFLIWKRIMPIINIYLPIKYQNYQNTTYYLEAGNMANYLNFLVIFLITIICLYIYFKEEENFKKEKLANIYFYFPIVSSSLALLSTQFGMFARVQYYFSFFFIIILPNMLNKLASREEKIIIYLVTIILFILYHTTILFFRPEWQHVYPFEFFWNHK